MTVISCERVAEAVLQLLMDADVEGADRRRAL